MLMTVPLGMGMVTGSPLLLTVWRVVSTVALLGINDTCLKSGRLFREFGCNYRREHSQSLKEDGGGVV